MVSDPMDQADIDTTGELLSIMYYIELILYLYLVSMTLSTNRVLDQPQQNNNNKHLWYQS